MKRNKDPKVHLQEREREERKRQTVKRREGDRRENARSGTLQQRTKVTAFLQGFREACSVSCSETML